MLPRTLLPVVTLEDKARIDALTKLNRGLTAVKRPSRLLTREEQIREVYRIEVMVPHDVEEREVRRQGVFTFDSRTPGAWFELRYLPPVRQR